jgi:HAMP domain-containing protein
MRTLSARILLGFAALTIAFGVITATVVVNMREVENEVQLIGNGYMQLTLRAKDIAHNEDELWVYLDKRIRDEPTNRVAQATLRRLIDARDDVVKGINPILDGLDALVHVDPHGISNLRPIVESVQTAVANAAPLYRAVLESPPIGPPGAELDAQQQVARNAYTTLRGAELAITAKTNELAKYLDRITKKRISELQENEHIVRVRTIYLGIVAVALGLMITIWVVITLRPLRRLREGARRVAAGDYGSRIAERGPAEVSGVAREFNAMGHAVQERERGSSAQQLAAVGTMAAMITHEVRNPLSSIGLNTELLEDELVGAPRESRARELCSAITKEVDRLTAITDEYLAFARLP